MAFAAKDTKLLWGRAAGICGNPECRTKVTEFGENGESFLTGEMAHIIAQSTEGPRGGAEAGSDSYENLILLCPTCHRRIDKSPEGTFTGDMLHGWKAEHEAWVDSWSEAKSYDTLGELAAEVSNLLQENHAHFLEYGPESELAKNNPGSTAQAIWAARKLDVILPNNQKIVRILEDNSNLLSGNIRTASVRFRMHARGFEDNQFERVENYPLFPKEFQDAIEELAG